MTDTLPDGDLLRHGDVLRLRKGADRRLRGGHLWIYSNEVDVAATPLKTFEPGSCVTVQSAAGETLGSATVSPNSLICARLHSRHAGVALDPPLIAARLRQALQLREALFPHGCYRLCFGDADGLPGLVVDRFGDYCSVQLATEAMDRRRDGVLAALDEVLAPVGVVWRNQGVFRQQEGLDEEVAVASGEVPERVVLTENDTRFEVPLLDGQKTGWFYDHRVSRAFLQQLAPGKRVLDVFSYIGGWGIQAAVAGACSVTCVDSSAGALEQVAVNAALNGVADRVDTEQGRAAEVLKSLAEQGRQFDVVVLDPPAFIKRRKDQREGEKAYHQINRLGLRLLAPGGVLVSASCSMHLPRERLLDIVRLAGVQQQRTLQLIHDGAQGADHPVHPAMPETAYLKALFFQDLPA